MIISPREKKCKARMEVRFCFGSILCRAYSLLTKLEVTITWLGRFFLRNLKFIWPKNPFSRRKAGWVRESGGGGVHCFLWPLRVSLVHAAKPRGRVSLFTNDLMMLV